MLHTARCIFSSELSRGAYFNCTSIMCCPRKVNWLKNIISYRPIKHGFDDGESPRAKDAFTMSRINRVGVRRKIKTGSASFGLNVSIFMNKWLAPVRGKRMFIRQSGFGGLARHENNGNASVAMRPLVNSLIMNDRSPGSKSKSGAAVYR